MNHYIVLVIPKMVYLKPLCVKGPITEVENGDFGNSIVQGVRGEDASQAEEGFFKVACINRHFKL